MSNSIEIWLSRNGYVQCEGMGTHQSGGVRGWVHISLEGGNVEFLATIPDGHNAAQIKGSVVSSQRMHYFDVHNLARSVDGEYFS